MELELKQEKKKKKRSSKNVQAGREKRGVVQTKKKTRSVKRRQGNKGKA